MLNSCVVNPKVGLLSSHCCNCSDAFLTPRYQASKVHTHDLIRSILPLWHKIRLLQVTTGCCGNLATRLQVGPLSSMIRLSSLSGWPQQSTMKVNSIPWQLTSHLGWALACTGIVEAFKHLLHVTTHPQFLVLELRVPMGACPGQYGIRKGLGKNNYSGEMLDTPSKTKVEVHRFYQAAKI